MADSAKNTQTTAGRVGDRAWYDFYDCGVLDGFHSENLTVPELLERSVAEYGDSTALIFLNRRITYSQLKEEIGRFATGLSKLGVRRGTRVAIQTPNIPQTVIAYYSALSLGAEVVMTNPLYVDREIEEQWNDANCTVAVVTDYLFEQRLKAIRDRLPVQHYIVAKIPEYLKFPLNLFASFKLKQSNPPLISKVLLGPGVHSFRQLVRRSLPERSKVVVDPDQVAVIQYTGGTTGASKGAMLTHRNLAINTKQVRAWFSTLEVGSERWLGSLPFFHVFGMTVAMNLPLHVGAAIVLMPDPRDIEQLIRNIVKHRVTVFPGVPAQFNAINNRSAVENVDLSSVKVCVSGSAPLPVDVLEQFERLTGSRIVEGYGLTEASPVTHCTPLVGRPKPGSIGLPLPGTDAKVVDLVDGTTEMSVDEPGELVIRGPQVMKGYWRQAVATSEALKDGWLHTGDIASVDVDGFFSILGRKKEMIIASGYNVYPDEVDRVLAAHSAVSESATIGVPDDRRGETVKSFVVLLPNQLVSADDLIAYARKELAAYKVPRQIEFRDELPKSSVLKILRRELREQEMTADVST